MIPFSFRTGYRRNLFLFVLGALAALAMPPFNLSFLLIPSFCGLAFLAHSAQRVRRAFADGWWWGLGFFMLGLYWMCVALLTEPEKFAWLIPFTLFGLNGLIALFPALTMALWRQLHPKGMWIVLSFASVWALMEYARGHVLTGFPWNLPGYTWSFSDAMAQSVSVIGIYGLSFVTVLAAVCPLNGKRWTLGAGLVLALMAGLGYLRLENAPFEDNPHIRLRLVQGNIAQHHKWQPELQVRHFQHYLGLTLSPGWENATHIVWPETAVPFALNREQGIIDLLRRASPEGGALLVGALTVEGQDQSLRVWNTLSVVTREEGIVENYKKHHLVPFGEFLPLRSVLPIDWLTPAGAVDFSRGPGPQTLALSGAPDFSPLICYEAIFPDEAVDSTHRPGWLLNITNDAWFGASTGPYQHFQMARFRAIEQGVPLVRSANTGISAIIDSYGRIRKYLGLNAQGVVDGALPKALEGDTTYSKYNDKILLLITVLILILSNLVRIR